MRINARAKVNLGLDIIGRRADGYHLLKMVMCSLQLCDIVRLERRDEGFGIRTHTAFADGKGQALDDQKNLAYRAAKLLLDEFAIEDGLEIFIDKNIPVEAGLAGGSTDAAAALRGTREIFNLPIDDERLSEIALKLGADVPYCLKGGVCLAEGIGEKLTALDKMPRCAVLLAKPSEGVSTKEVYSGYDGLKSVRHPNIDYLIDAIGSSDLRKICESLGNVLEEVTAAKVPKIREIKRQMSLCGALGSLMSGSGTAVFGIFEDDAQAAAAKEAMREKFEGISLIETHFAG